MNAKCFLITETDQVKRALRRYTSDPNPRPDQCPANPGQYSYHTAKVDLDVVPESRQHEQAARDLAAWPARCACGYEFKPADQWQTFKQHLYRRDDTGELTTLSDAPTGAMWFADWMHHSLDQNWYRGPDGHCLMIRGFYGDDFCPDQRASNCTLPKDDSHKCWVRVGTVPNITIGKTGGPTCGAGAGSFFFGRNPDGKTFKWHGFCRNGELVQG